MTRIKPTAALIALLFLLPLASSPLHAQCLSCNGDEECVQTSLDAFCQCSLRVVGPGQVCRVGKGLCLHQSPEACESVHGGPHIGPTQAPVDFHRHALRALNREVPLLGVMLSVLEPDSSFGSESSTKGSRVPLESEAQGSFQGRWYHVTRTSASPCQGDVTVVFTNGHRGPVTGRIDATYDNCGLSGRATVEGIEYTWESDTRGTHVR